MVGAPAPELVLEQLLQVPENTDTSWTALRGTVVVVDFWATWCGPCAITLPHLNALAKEFEGEPVQFIAVAKEPLDKVQDYLAQRPINAWVALDLDKSVFDEYLVDTLPRTVIVDRNGIIAAITHPMKVNADTLRAVLKGKLPRTDAAS